MRSFPAPEERRTGPNSEAPASGRWPIAGLGFLAVAWGMFLLTQSYADRLAEKYGPTPDVWDALDLAAHIGRNTLPSYTAVLVLDGLAILALIVPTRAGGPRVVRVLALVLLVPSVPVHALRWLGTSLFTP
jgi:hypothetical protein